MEYFRRIFTSEKDTPNISNSFSLIGSIEQLRSLTESFQHIADQSAQLEASADEIERLSRNLTSINTIYEMHLKSLGSQIGNIDQVNDQTRRMAEQIEELNRVYDRMLQSMTVNMNVSRDANTQSKEA